MIQECKACEDLLVQYIQAGNELIDCRQQLKRRVPTALRRRAVDLIANATQRKAELAKRLRRHRQQHA